MAPLYLFPNDHPHSPSEDRPCPEPALATRFNDHSRRCVLPHGRGDRVCPADFSRYHDDPEMGRLAGASGGRFAEHRNQGRSSSYPDGHRAQPLRRTAHVQAIVRIPGSLGAGWRTLPIQRSASRDPRSGHRPHHAALAGWWGLLGKLRDFRPDDQPEERRKDSTEARLRLIRKPTVPRPMPVTHTIENTHNISDWDTFLVKI